MRKRHSDSLESMFDIKYKSDRIVKNAYQCVMGKSDNNFLFAPLGTITTFSVCANRDDNNSLFARITCHVFVWMFS